jgi:hypothetical protein
MDKAPAVAVLSTAIYVVICYMLVVRPFFCDPSYFEELLVLSAALVLSSLLFVYNFVFSKTHRTKADAKLK